MNITPVILAGGIGSRLWPLSRKSYPKQFAALISGQSLFQTTLERLSGEGFDAPMVLTGADFRFIVTEQMAQSGKQAQAILIEPEGRNTAPAILAAAKWLEAHRPDTLMLVAPSDHAIPDAAGFRAAVRAASAAAEAGRLVTFGITPTRPETGYGYIELSDPAQAEGVQPVARFVEKPDRATAEQMLATGGYLWNGGIFLFSPAALIAAFEAHAPGLLPPVTAALEEGRHDLDFLKLDPEAWAGAEEISIDHAIMERSDRISVQPWAGAWSDLGDWRAVSEQLPQDASGNALTGAVSTIDCESSLLYAEDGGPELVGVGLRDLLVVAMRDAVLVADRNAAQKVKDVVALQRDKATPAAESFPWDHRPWGRFETLALGSRFQVKRIVVKPGGILSLQSHHHRAEHWIVVEGTALVTIGDTQTLVSENQSVYVPLGETHRMENPGKVPMVLIEVQTGTYLGEDDIIRYEDVYARDQGAKG
ncbi:mannose-1-phosphate guanylyltransferase/mannose-6-phosphate isomerase (plasmid) [Roseovarius faecimaris]|uniref:mannose-1-phosphate guanylyltransferase n=1 Tax=Roseovarius faecimaris TaxID=2494550 RepID=A0A6I6ILN1_9RHOB|nr:mannose-1-phosphate guanylyltransferase/mannose-6-phosphate isomerase [Roseovarius faecimaris]QGX96771.1 mannose-1-phosphate guanylyltransferase/mannose-6-phosphate isomerase [Roseovarius faecimaris]